MKRMKFTRIAALALALILMSAALPTGARAASDDIRELIATDVTLDQTRFEYTGQEVKPNVTVRVQGKLLILDQDYTLAYRNNVEVGTAAVEVTGIPASGYTGTVEHPFYIDPRTSEEDRNEPTTIIGTDVQIEGTQFPFTGEAVEPAITVTVAGKTLTAGEDYTLVYENNVRPGTGSVTVTGVADKGYTGSVTIHFTIQAAPQEPTQPEPTQPEPTQPEPTQPDASGPREYRITKGSGDVWHKDSGKDLSFTADGSSEALKKVRIDGKSLNSKYYTAEGDQAVVTLQAKFLQSLEEGRHTITLEFRDGEAQGFFKVAAPADDSNPKTGDGFALHGWTALLFISLTGIIGTAYACRRKLWK